MTPEKLVSDLLDVLPELGTIYDEHIADNDTLLPHVFMGAVARFVVAHAEEAAFEDSLRRLLGALEQGMVNGSTDVRELVAASFVENLAGEDATISRLRPKMGPLLREHLDRLLSGRLC